MPEWGSYSESLCFGSGSVWIRCIWPGPDPYPLEEMLINCDELVQINQNYKNIIFLKKNHLFCLIYVNDRRKRICSILGRIRIKMKRIRYTAESWIHIYIFNIDGTYVCRLISPSTAYVLCDSGHSIYILMDICRFIY